MPIIKLETRIAADLQTCFDLSRSIDAHALSMAHSKERAIAGKTAGLIGLHETVTWKARHFGIWWTPTSRITQMDAPHSFTDEIVRGPFKRMRHQHRFIAEPGHTLMIDEFDYASPLGVLGQLADRLFVAPYLSKLLAVRDLWIKARSEKSG